MITGAFIFITGNTTSKQQSVVIEHDTARVFMHAVNSVEEAIEVAKRIVEEDNCIIIELCGGFGIDSAREVSKALDDKVPIGYVEYLPEHIDKIEEVFRSLSTGK